MSPDYSTLSDGDLVEAVAINVMGWKKVQAPQGCHWQWHERDGKYPYRYDVDGSCLRCAGSGAFKPTIDWNHSMEVVAKVSRVWKIKYDGYCEVNFGTSGWHIEHHDPQRAICLAALLAVSA